ncbi:hypothetical protein FDUTEX481_04754 [Tolypothrix sp. PCC 7601]|nr:hypothetical protein FDUTEX481_04754 [Tolypothrix sp. PCC 7601]
MIAPVTQRNGFIVSGVEVSGWGRELGSVIQFWIWDLGFGINNP